ncbi:RagB/SusD family nutrient uptake outer membrane protein, partial [Flavobacteriaceae bacterium]|nr:RagB/SusD family nutrient uptake outer membrane protein [Flavobacteriaceae bacterium]
MKNIYLFLTLLIFIVSCTDDTIFEAEPLDKYAETSVWTTESLSDTFINEVYNGLPNSFAGMFSPDANTVDWYDHHNNANGQAITKGNLNPANSAGWGVTYNKGGDYITGNQSGLWGYMYKKIRAVNTVLKNLNSEDQAFMDSRTGEVLTLRAIFYSRLALAFGKVINVGDDLLGLESDYLNMKQSPFLETMAYINSELDKAILLLPESQPEKGRITKYAAMAQKAEMLLIAASPRFNGGSYNTSLLQEAKAVNEAIVSSGKFSLLPNFADATKLLDGNTELIFGRFMTAKRKIDRDNYTDHNLAPGGAGGFTTYTPTQNLVDQFEVIDGTTSFIPATWSNNVRTVTSNSAYSDDDMYSNRDPRFYETVFYQGAKRNATYTIDVSEGGQDSRSCTGCQWWNNGFFGYYVKKFIGTYLNGNWPSPEINDGVTTLHRLAGVYLNHAEILFQLGDQAGALNMVNTIRKRAGMVEYTSIDMDKIKHETVVEMIGEGKRFNNLRRWDDIDEYHKTGEWGIKYTNNGDGTYASEFIEISTPSWNDKFYWIPIPQKEMDKNPGL